MIEKAFLIGVNVNKDSIAELENLALSCNYEVIGICEQNLHAVNPAYYMGQGKVNEIKEIVQQKEIDVVIFENELSPTQLRNVEKILSCRVIDRTNLILDIFAKRAKTKEAKLQVEVARLKYMLPRLIGNNEHLSRQRASAGTTLRGAGEKKLELDRRRIEEKITFLEKELEVLIKERKTQREKRLKSQLPFVSIIGYTNAGKSSLMNAIIEYTEKADDKKVFEKDMLFATLETTVRNIRLKDNKTFLLSDTIGFINKLPHHLVKAFRSTLEEILEADLLLHVVDVSNESYKEQINVTIETLKQIGVANIPMIIVYNKTDLTSNQYPYIRGNEIYISAKNGIGIEELIGLIKKAVLNHYVLCKMLIPYNNGGILSYLIDNALVKSITYQDNGTLISLECKESDYIKFNEYAL